MGDRRLNRHAPLQADSWRCQASQPLPVWQANYSTLGWYVWWRSGAILRSWCDVETASRSVKPWCGRTKLVGPSLRVLTPHIHGWSCTSWWAWRISCGLLASRAPVLPASPSHLKLLRSPGWSSGQLCAVYVQECPCPSQDMDPRQLSCIQPVTSQVWRKRSALVALGNPLGSSWGNPTGSWVVQYGSSCQVLKIINYSDEPE